MTKPPTRDDLHDTIRKRVHRGILTDPAEEELLGVCGKFAVLWCNKVRKQFKLPIPSVTFFSFHPNFNLVLAWAADDRSGEDKILSVPEKVKALKQRGRYCPAHDFVGLSTLCLHQHAAKIRGIYLRPGIAAFALIDNEWVTLQSQGQTLDPSLAKILAVEDRVYLPISSDSPAVDWPWGGAFMVELPNGESTKPYEEVKTTAKKIIVEYENWPTDQKDAVTSSFPIVHPVWEVLWASTRESRTLLPHQASFRRVLQQISNPNFWQQTDSFLGVAHFDFNDFKKLNELAGYEGADQVVEWFIANLCKEVLSISGWSHPISTNVGTWASLRNANPPPNIGWFVSRIGGDEFGLVYISTESCTQQTQTAIQQAVHSTSELMRQLGENNVESWKQVSEHYNLSCIGAHIELPLTNIQAYLDQEDGFQITDELWRFVGKLSQEVKSDFKADMGNNVYLSLSISEALNRWEKARVVHPHQDSGELRSLFNVPFIDLPDFLKRMPFLEQVSMLGVDKKSRVVLCERRIEVPKDLAMSATTTA